MPEIYVVVSLAFAVFAAVSAVGSAIVLGIGYERLRSGLDRVKEGLDLIGRQTGFFSTELYKLEQRVEQMDSDHTPAKKVSTRSKSVKGKTKKTKLQTENVSQTLKEEGGTISVPFVRNPSNDLRVYMTGMKDDGFARLSSTEESDLAEGKIRFM